VKEAGGSAKIPQKSLQRGRLRIRRSYTVVIAGDSEDRRRVIAVGIIKLVVIISIFARAADHIAPMEAWRDRFPSRYRHWFLMRQ